MALSRLKVRALAFLPLLIAISTTGGCALNVQANQRVRDALGAASSRHRALAVYVPSAPGDGGLAVGAAWTVGPPVGEAQGKLHLSGPYLWDVMNLRLEDGVADPNIGQISLSCIMTKNSY